jgi:adenylate kinase
MMILLLGPPGSGKSVQGQLLVKRNNWKLLSTGDLFRRAKDPEILKHLAGGELVDDTLTNSVVHDAMAEITKDVEIVLDGYPRNIGQAQWLIANATYQRRIESVIILDVPDQELTKRLTNRGREEDSLEIMKHRLAIYNHKTSPVIDFYREHNTPIMVVDGVGTIEEVHERVQLAVMTCLATE